MSGLPHSAYWLRKMDHTVFAQIIKLIINNVLLKGIFPVSNIADIFVTPTLGRRLFITLHIS